MPIKLEGGERSILKALLDLHGDSNDYVVAPETQRCQELIGHFVPDTF
jgi:hypothetical protein